MPYVLVTRSPDIKTIRDFTDKDRIALPAVKLTGHAIALQMAAAKEWGREHYDKLDAITISLSHPDATAALLAGKGEINAHFASSPFYYIELATPGVHQGAAFLRCGGRAPHQRRADGLEEVLRRQPEGLRGRGRRAGRGQRLHQGQPAQGGAKSISTMTKEKRSTLDEMEKMVTDPDVDYTTTPVSVMKFVEFMNLAGTVKKKPASWKDLFFPIAYDRPGS